MAQWTVETQTEDERGELGISLDLHIVEIFSDGSILVDCPSEEAEDDLIEYCEDKDFDCCL